MHGSFYFCDNQKKRGKKKKETKRILVRPFAREGKKETEVVEESTRSDRLRSDGRGKRRKKEESMSPHEKREKKTNKERPSVSQGTSVFDPREERKWAIILWRGEKKKKKRGNLRKKARLEGGGGELAYASLGASEGRGKGE